MKRQLALTAAAAAPVATADRFAAYRREHPNSKFIEFRDQRTGRTFPAQIPPSSPWHELLPDSQVVDIRPVP